MCVCLTTLHIFAQSIIKITRLCSALALSHAIVYAYLPTQGAKPPRTQFECNNNSNKFSTTTTTTTIKFTSMCWCTWYINYNTTHSWHRAKKMPNHSPFSTLDSTKAIAINKWYKSSSCFSHIITVKWQIVGTLLFIVISHSGTHTHRTMRYWVDICHSTPYVLQWDFHPRRTKPIYTSVCVKQWNI